MESILAKTIRERLQKEAFIPAQAGPPPMDPAMAGGAPPMDPAQAGGAPPMDPAMMGGGAPPMDPAMAGAPPMDPAQAGTPPMDPAQAGGEPDLGQVPIGSMPVDVFVEMIAEVVSRTLQEMGTGAPQGAKGGEGKLTTEDRLAAVEDELRGLAGAGEGNPPQAPPGMPKMAAEGAKIVDAEVMEPIDTRSLWIERNEKLYGGLLQALRKI